MKAAFTLLILLLFANTHSAQKIRFTDTSNEWREQWTGIGSLINKYYSYKGEAVIGGNLYRDFGLGLVREDSGRVFLNRNGTDIVLYDYTLNVGDTLFYISGSDTCSHRLGNIFSITIDTLQYKAFRFDVICGSMHPYIVIDGIGCMSGLLYPIDGPIMIEQSRKILCFKNNGKIVDAGGYVNSSTCAVNVAEVKGDINNEITVTPHPVTSGSIMALPYTMKKVTYTLYNTVGQIEERRAVSNTDKISLHQHNTGIYYYIVTDNVEGKVFRGTIMFE